MRKELLNLDIVDKCTFDGTETGAEAMSRICRTHVNECFLGRGMSTETAAEEIGKFTCQLLAQKKPWINVQHLSVIVVYKCSKALC